MCANLYFLDDVSQLPDMLFISMTEVALVLKNINFFVNNRRLQYMLRCIRDFPMENQREHDIMTARLHSLAIQVLVYCGCIVISVSSSAISTALSGQEKLMYSGYYPGLDWKNNVVSYWCVFAYQYVGIMFTGFINVAIESYFCAMMYLLSGHIHILGIRLSQLGMQRTTLLEQRSMLIKHIQLHIEIIDFIRNLQHCLWWSFMCQLILSAVTVGSSMVAVLNVSIDVVGGS